MKLLKLSFALLLGGCAGIPEQSMVFVESPSEAISGDTLIANVGIETKSGFATFLREGCKLPCVMEVNFKSLADNSNRILLRVARSDNNNLAVLKSLGTYSITGFPPKSASESVIYIEFHAEKKGIAIMSSKRNGNLRLSIEPVPPSQRVNEIPAGNF